MLNVLYGLFGNWSADCLWMGITQENKIFDESRKKYIQNSCKLTSHRIVIFAQYLLLFVSVAVIVSHIFEKYKCGITKAKVFFSLLLNCCVLWSSTFRKQQIANFLELGVRHMKEGFKLAIPWCYTTILRCNNIEKSIEWFYLLAKYFSQHWQYSSLY